MPYFERSTPLPFPRQELFQYHANPGALNRLIPPWENIVIEQRGDSLEVGTEVVIRNSLFGIPVRLRARHTELQAPDRFQDIQVAGPFKSWIHDHVFESTGSTSSILHDRVQYEMRFGILGSLGLPVVGSKLAAMFAFRHATTQADLELQNFLKPFVENRILRIGVTGSTGMIGRRLIDLMSVMGHQAIRILRPASKDRPEDFPSSAKSVVWRPNEGFSDVATMQGLDAVIHLGGQGIASARWSEAVKNSIRSSRVEGTQALVLDLAKLAEPPRALVCASGVGIYGNRGSDVLDETTAPASDFLATLAEDWEASAMQFERSGNRVAIGRLGIVLHPRQGALAKLLPPFQLGVGGPVGRGDQYWSWIHVDDAAGAFLYLAANPNCTGPYNLVAPEQTDNKTFSATLARVLHRPSFLPVPAFALRILLGEMADAMLLASSRATPSRLLSENFPFRARRLEDGLRCLLGRFV